MFLLSGLWHGAAWHFVVWGGLHAAYLTVGTSTALVRSRVARALGLHRVPRVHAALRTATTFALVSFAWIFFRATDVTDALVILARLLDGWTTWSRASLDAMGTTLADFRVLAATVAVVEVVSWLDHRAGSPAPLAGRWGPLRALGYASLVAGILEFGVVDTVPFIYAQF